jgi:hypothetical protein
MNRKHFSIIFSSLQLVQFLFPLLLAHALDRLDILIGPGGLLLLGYDLLQPMFYVCGWALGNNKSKSWM